LKIKSHCMIKKAVVCIHREFHRRKDEAKYMSMVFWTAFKYKMKISIEMKRKGKTMEQRVAREAKFCLMFSAQVES